jgi:hypothetical protein
MFGDFGRKVIASRQRQAERQVCATLLGFDDEMIAKAGYTRAELKRKAAGAVYF